MGICSVRPAGMTTVVLVSEMSTAYADEANASSRATSLIGRIGAQGIPLAADFGKLL